MIPINQLTTFDGSLADKSTMTKEEFSEAVYYTHKFYNNSFIPQMATVIDRVNQLGSELNAQMSLSNYKGDWLVGSTYALGESVSRNDVVYYSKTAENVGFDPETYTDQWQAAEFIIEKNSAYVTYDPTISGMTATDVKSAIDELAATRDLAVLTKTFTTDETYNIQLSRGVYSPYVAVTKEIVAGGLIDDTWNVNPTGVDFDAEDTAYAVTIKPSAVSGLITLTLGSGSFAAGDVGKTIEFNGGSCVIVDESPATAYVKTAFTNTSTVNSGEWTMKAVQFDESDGAYVSNINTNNLTLAGTLPWYYKNVTITGFDNNSSTIGSMHPDGTKVYFTDYNNLKIYQLDLSVAGDIQSAAYNGKYINISGVTTVPYCFFYADNTHCYLAMRNGYIMPVTVTSKDITTLTAGTAVDFTTWVGTGSYKYMSTVFSADGTKVFVGVSGGGTMYSFSLSTPFNLSTKSYDNISNNSISVGATMQLSSDGYSMYSFNSSVKKYTLVSPNSIASTALVETSMAMAALGGIIIDKADCQHIIALNRGLSGGTVQLQDYSIGLKKAYEDTYIPMFSNTSGQIMTINWDSITAYNCSETLAGGNAYYAISNDDSTTFLIQKESSTPRAIVRLNGTYWEYNSNATWGSETWVAASPNTKYQAMRDAIAVAINRMDSAQLEASLVNITSSTYLDLCIILYAPDVDHIPYSDGMTVEYQANSLYKMAIPGTDYEYSHPAPNIVSFKSLADNNLKVRIV